MNLRYVYSFVTVARLGSFRAAAVELGLSQASVSHHLRALETELGARLLERGGSICQPTAAGLRFLPRARSLLRLCEQARTDMTHERLRIGAASNIGIYLLPRLLQHYRALQPDGPEPVLEIGPNPTTVKRLTDGEVDLALTEWWQPIEEFKSIVWRSEELVVIVPPGHDWADRHHICREELACTKLLAGEPGSGTGRLLRTYLHEVGKMPSIAAELASTEAVKQAVAHGLGISLVLASSVAEEVATGRLAALPLNPRGLYKPLWAAWRHDEQLGDGRDAMLKILTDASRLPA